MLQQQRMEDVLNASNNTGHIGLCAFAPLYDMGLLWSVEVHFVREKGWKWEEEAVGLRVVWGFSDDEGNLQ